MFGYSGAPGQDLPPLYKDFQHIKGVEKLDSRLLRAADAAQQKGQGLDQTLNVHQSQKTASGALIVELVTGDVTDALLAEIEAAGAQVQHASAHFQRVTVTTTDPAAVLALAAIDGIQMIRPASGRKTNGTGSVDGYADRSLQTIPVQDHYGVDGTGVRIGILSDSFASPWVLPNLRSNSFSESGSAAEAVVDLPPGEYTVVMQGDEDQEVRLAWISTESLMQSSITFPPEETACRGRIALQGTQGSVTTRSRDLPDYPTSSCGEGSGVSLFAFSLTNAASIQFTGLSGGGGEVSLSIRTDCTDSASEIICVEGEIRRGYSGLTNQLSGDLPPFVTILQEGPAAGFGEVINEGAAMAELVYDIAPGVEIGFHTAFISEASFAEGIYRLANVILDPDDEPFFAHIIVDDVIYFREPMYQTGIVAQAVKDVVNSTIWPVTYFSAAGNSANTGFKVRYAPVSGTSNAYPPNGASLMRWPHGSGFLPITMEPGTSFMAVIQWNQPWESLSGPNQGAQIDMNAYLTYTPNAAGILDAIQDVSQIRTSENIQGDGTFYGWAQGDPYEEIVYTNRSGQRRTVYLAIDHYRGFVGNIPQFPEPLEVRVVFPIIDTGVTIHGVDEKDSSTGGPTIWGHAQEPEAIAVGAVNWYDTPAWDMTYGPTPEIDPEPFSALGGELHITFDRSGAPAPRYVFKPDIMAVDGNNTTFFPPTGSPQNDFDQDGHPNFFGTSAAAPNAAAVAALLRQLNPSLSPQEIFTSMAETALDVKGERAAPGRDPVSGHGLINGFAAAQYIEENFGVRVGGSAPRVVIDTFSSGTDGWTPNEGVPSSFITAPAAPDAAAGSLDLTATDTTNTLGWWKSPQFIASPVTSTGPSTAVNIERGNKSLGRATFYIDSDAPVASDSPTIRVRQSASTFERSDVMVITPVGSAAFSPSLAADPKEYTLYFSLPSSAARFNLFQDLVGLDGLGMPGVTVKLDRVDLEGFPGGTDILTQGRLETLLFFDTGSGNSNGWRLESPLAGGMKSAQGAVTTRGLRIGPANDPAAVCYTFWNSPESAPRTHFEANRLYRASARFTSNAPAGVRNTMPTYRFRANAGSYQWASYVDINSVGNASQVPTGGEDIDVVLYFSAPNELVGQPVNFAFDYLYVPGIGKDPSLTLTLRSLRVDSYLRPASTP